ncbi:serine protease gd-like [Coccinella septempunctata]|uniref:serine protease gd-like n=1 Tax=Coccinella septempunctata TaxID=41139 RepID=UPI001D08FD09|nr:serine protease gd-like [Coccinella septempunctata]XP_044763936.1 serine protease gd-like [Coccinella septempunctata]XP_044763937.1 serine protease gd-like [Coccinella septempunctata]
MGIDIYLVASAAFLLLSVEGQNFSSPCPRLFSYESKSIEKDKYFGNVRVETREELSGVWLKMLFDKPCVQLGNWLGEVSTEDNREFLIKRPKLVLKPGDFLTVRFYVKFTPGREIPQLLSIKLNNKLVCPESTQQFPQMPQVTSFEVLLEDRNGNETSSVFITTTTNRTPPSPYNLIQEIELPGPTSPRVVAAETEDYGEFFQGDLSLVNFRPKRDECGTVMPPKHHSLSHLDEVYEGAFPWHAAIYLSKGTELNYICAANLISSKFLLTVAHCVTKRNSEVVVRPEHLLIYLGKYYLRRWSNPALQERQVQNIYIHEEYDHVAIKNDIALLKLLKPVKITDYVRPVCLWRGGSRLESIVGEYGAVVGWGFNQNGIVTNKLVRTFMPIVSREICINNYPGFYQHFTLGKSYCASFQNETSICNGDSGGGMIFSKKTPGSHYPTHYLRGVISLSVALQNEFRCDDEHFAIFTDIAEYLPWLDKFGIN